MEKNLPNDKLEDFLKKSFEGYTESPPDDLWGKIEDGLGTDAPATRPLILKWWWIVAAAALVLGIFVCQHFYFENKIDRLTKELEQNATELQGPETEPQNDVLPLPQQTEGSEVLPSENKPQASVNTPSGQPGETNAVAEAPTGKPGGNSPAPSENRSTIRDAGASFHEEKNKENNAAAGGRQTANPAENELVTTEILKSEPAATTTENEPIPSITGPFSTGRVAASIESLPALPAQMLTVNLPTPAPQFKQLTPVLAGGSRLSLGLRAMPMSVTERISKVRPERFPHRPGRPEKYFNNESQVTGDALATGATLELDLGKNWSFAGGLDYRRTTTTSRHRSEFRFNERVPHPGGPDMRQHDFQYNLNTSSGLVEVELRAEQIDTTQPIPDTEQVAFEVITRKNISVLSLPLAMKYSIGNGRLHVYLKGGLSVNFLLRNDFEIRDVSSLNPRFQVRRDAPVRVAPQSLKSVTLEYLAAAGVSYDLTESLSLNLEPTLMGSLTSAHSSNFIRSASTLAGVSAGLSYHF